MEYRKNMEDRRKIRETHFANFCFQRLGDFLIFFGNYNEKNDF